MKSPDGSAPVICQLQRLSPREYQVAQLVGQGLSDQEIADEIHVSLEAVAHHLTSIYAKLGTSSRSALEFAVIDEQTLPQRYLEWEAENQKEGVRIVSPTSNAGLIGHSDKPDPLSAGTLSELEDHLRSLWAWAGRPSSRDLAASSGGAFSHATVSKIMHNSPRKPVLKLKYVLGIVRACGCDQEEQQRWVAAWRTSSRADLGAVVGG
jgi:DNA-binding CsgD family transcriptional regulator